MNVFTKDGRKFAKSCNGEVYDYKFVVIAMVATAVVAILLMMFGFALFVSDCEELSFTFVAREAIALAIAYVGYKIGKVFYNILMKF